jgi:hypothetical protein
MHSRFKGNVQMPLPLPVDQSSRAAHRVHSAIASAAERTGVDFDFLLREASLESGLNPAARARTSSATGLFQFTRQTWLATIKEHGADHGLDWAAAAITQNPDGRYTVADPALREQILNLRNEPEAAAAMAAELASGHEQLLEAKLGRTAQPVDLYLAHFLGEAGAIRFLEAHDTNPAAAAAPLLPAAAAANRSIFYAPDGRARSLSDIRDNFAAKLGKVPPLAPAAVPAFTSTQLALSRLPSRLNAADDSSRDNTLALLTIEPMPQKLSLDFARTAYQRLAAMSSAS